MKHKILFYTFICFAAVFFSVSCAQKQEIEQEPDLYIYNGVSTLWVCSGGGCLYDASRAPRRMIDLADGREYDFIRDPFFDAEPDNDPTSYIFAGKEYLYYLMDDGSKKWIVQRDYGTMEEKTVYEKVFWREQRNLFLGAIQSSPPSSYDIENALHLSYFCVFDNCLFLFCENKIQKVDLTTGSETVVSTKGLYNYSYAYYQGKLYFVSKDYSVWSYEIQADRLERFDGVKARLLLLTPEGIFYSNANAGGVLFRMDYNGENRVRLTDREILCMDFMEDTIYYAAMDRGHVYAINTDGGSDRVLIELSDVFSIYALKECRELVILHENDKGDFAMERYGGG